MLAGSYPQRLMFPPGREYPIVYHQRRFVDSDFGGLQSPFT